MIDLFHDINPRNKAKLLKLCEAERFTFQKGCPILSNIVGSNIIAYIELGNIQIIKNDYNGSKIIIDDLKEEEIFDFKMISFGSNEYEIIAKEDTTLITIDFQTILKGENLNFPAYIQFLKNLMELMSQKLLNAEKRIEILTNKTIRNRLLAYFNITSRQVNSKIIYLPYSFTDLSSFLGVDRCAMTRELKNLKEEKLIDIKGRRIKLLYYGVTDYMF